MKRRKNYSEEKHCECGKLITNVSKRCMSCSKKDTLNSMYIDGRTNRGYFCINCKNPISPESWLRGGKRCYSCANKGELSSGWIDGRSIKEYFCSDCKNTISYPASLYGKGRCLSCANKGKNNPNYIDGSSKKLYPSKFNNKLKYEIRKRDNYTCQKCFITEKEYLLIYDKVLSVHHIDYNKENCLSSNLITLCSSCNTKANKNKKYWKKLFLIPSGGIIRNKSLAYYCKANLIG